VARHRHPKAKPGTPDERSGRPDHLLRTLSLAKIPALPRLTLARLPAAAEIDARGLPWTSPERPASLHPPEVQILLRQPRGHRQLVEPAKKPKEPGGARPLRFLLSHGSIAACGFRLCASTPNAGASPSSQGRRRSARERRASLRVWEPMP
jgi:hypothetical protein